MSQERRSVLPDSFEMLGFFNRVLQKHLLVDRMYRMRRNQWLTAPQSKKDEDRHEFQDNVFTVTTDENCKILGGGMINDRVENLNMTGYVRTFSGKTISVKCDRRQNAVRIMEIVERKTSTPRDQLYIVNQVKVLNDKQTIEESSTEARATIEMSLRIMGGMEKEELMETSETQEDIKKRKLQEPSESKPSRLSEDVVHFRREIRLDQIQSEDQGGFRVSYQAIDHFAIYRMIEQKCHEW